MTGMVAVNCFKVSAGAEAPGAAMAATLLLMRSAANLGNRSILALGRAVLDRNVLAFDVAHFTQPLTKCGNEIDARLGRAHASRYPITGIACCCARAATSGDPPPRRRVPR